MEEIKEDKWMEVSIGQVTAKFKEIKKWKAHELMVSKIIGLNT